LEPEHSAVEPEFVGGFSYGTQAQPRIAAETSPEDKTQCDACRFGSHREPVQQRESSEAEGRGRRRTRQAVPTIWNTRRHGGRTNQARRDQSGGVGPLAGGQNRYRRCRRGCRPLCPGSGSSENERERVERSQASPKPSRQADPCGPRKKL